MSTLLLNALLVNDFDEFEYILQQNDFHGEQIDSLGRLGVNCLHMSVYRRSCTKYIDQLLAYGANINYLDRYGNSAAHIACMIGNYEALVILCHYPQCNLDLLNLIKLTPMDIAKQYQDISRDELSEILQFDDTSGDYSIICNDILIGRKKCHEFLLTERDHNYQGRYNLFVDELVGKTRHWQYHRKLIQGGQCDSITHQTEDLLPYADEEYLTRDYHKNSSLVEDIATKNMAASLLGRGIGQAVGNLMRRYK